MIKIKLFFATLFFLLTSAPISYAEEIWKITSLNWPPYSDSSMSSQGNSVQKLREILKQAGVRLVVEFYPWQRAQAKAKTEEYVGYFPAWPEEVREGFVGSLAIDWSEVGIIKRSGSEINYKNVDDLFQNYEIGIVSSYVYPKAIMNAIDRYPDKVDFAPSDSSLVKMLSKGRHDVSLNDPLVMMYLADKLGISNVEPLAQIITKKELVLAFRDDEKNKRRIELLNSLLKADLSK